MNKCCALFMTLSLVGCDGCSKETAPPAESSADAGITEAMVAKVAGPVPTTGKISAMTPLAVECSNPGQPVSPTIFGIAFADADKDLNATAFRWGGNTTTRYNWRIGAWNTAHDWFWQNIKIDSYEVFLEKAGKLGGRAAITIPMIGWAAKDTKSASFPVSVFGPQDKTDPD